MNVATASPPIDSTTEQSSLSEKEWELMPEPNIDELIIEDDQPVDNLISEKQQRLLTSSAYSSFNLEIPFLATANVGLFYAKCPEDWSQKKNRSYFTWNFGKAPEVAIEIVSNQVGNELGSKLNNYLDAGVGYYVVFDPLKCLGDNILQVYQRKIISYQLQDNYWLEEVNLGLTLWSGEFEGQFYDQWLRWCDQSGNVLLTGDEKFELEKQRADRLAQLLREQGIDPDLI